MIFFNSSTVQLVVGFLLEMDRRLAVAGMMALPMCRRDIGDYLGLTLETVSRALSGFPALVRSSFAIVGGCGAWMRETSRAAPRPRRFGGRSIIAMGWAT